MAVRPYSFQPICVSPESWWRRSTTLNRAVIVSADVPIVSIEPGTRMLLVPGAHVIVFANKTSDGALTAMAVNVGENGLTPQRNIS
jgi:hypothetical protein